MNLERCWPTAVLALAVAGPCPDAVAKPIAYAHGTTVMAEYGEGTNKEAQVFYAPRYDLSAGAGVLELRNQSTGRTRRIVYGRANWLLKRWNLEDAQANVFAWGGAGGASIDGGDNSFAWNAGGQVDYETRRTYFSARIDYHDADDFANRIDTVQAGLAPYAHDYEGLATWFVLQGRHYTGDIRGNVEWSLLLRLFKGGAWIEAGTTLDGDLQAMLMFNF